MTNPHENLPPGCSERDKHFAEPECSRRYCGRCGKSFVSFVGMDEIQTIEDAVSDVDRRLWIHEGTCK